MKIGQTCFVKQLAGSLTLAAMTIALLPFAATAMQWRPLAQTSLHDVDIDMDSVKLTPLGRMAVWLRFKPLGEHQRRLASAEYGEKGYRLHLEHFEVDCSEQSNVLMLIDIIGNNGKRLTRMKGGGNPAIIQPGSALDLAAKKICPSLEKDAATEDEEETSTENSKTPDSESKQGVGEHLTRIEAALQKTKLEPGNQTGWRELGNAYYDADMPNLAIDAYNQVLKGNPDDIDVLNDQGAMYRQLGDFSHALENFEKVLKIDANNLESLYNIGYVNAFDLNRIDKALIAWRRYLQLEKTTDIARQVESFVERYGKTP